MIEAWALTRRFGDFTAVREMTFSVADGEILGILGPNGAGKTTTIRMITGFLPPSEGQVTLDGVDLHEQPTVARRQLGYLPENVALYPEMRVHEYLTYRARLAGLGRAQARPAIDDAIASCLLDAVQYQIIGTLSKGYRQRVGLAAAILHGPRVLVLDEPTVGLDPKQIIAIRELIRDLGRERTLLLSTHILPEVEQLCDRVVIIDRGRLVAEGSPKELQLATGGGQYLGLTLEGHGEEAADRLGQVPGITSVEAHPSVAGRFRLAFVGDDPRRELFHLAVDQGWVLLEMAEERVSLEDVFVRLTADQVRAEPPSPVGDGGQAVSEQSGADAESGEER
ncbi:MAG: ABC transporter ATP-binding protein [Holophagales bacterium]|nr:ABC transporter ATP-binding protein [Holophagales bacterium]